MSNLLHLYIHPHGTALWRAIAVAMAWGWNPDTQSPRWAQAIAGYEYRVSVLELRVEDARWGWL